MPIPIVRINDNGDDFKGNEKSFNIDYSFLINPVSSSKRTVEASDKDAENVLQIWANSSSVDGDKYKISSDINQNELKRLSAKGFLECEGDVFKFTNRGKMIITTMTLGENNNFLKVKKQRSYKEILASMDKRGKAGYRTPKLSSGENLLGE